MTFKNEIYAALLLTISGIVLFGRGDDSNVANVLSIVALFLLSIDGFKFIKKLHNNIVSDIWSEK